MSSISVSAASDLGAAPTRRSRFAAAFPRGRSLPGDVWASRHRWVVALLGVQAAIIPPFALLRGFPLEHGLAEALVPVAMAILACWSGARRPLRSTSAGMGLMVAAGIVVHLSGGSIEAHFLFFAMVPVVALYESWLPFGLAIGFVLVEHGIVGTLAPHSVYDHHAAREHPWTWAGIHAALFSAACVGSMVNWGLHERARAEATVLSHQIHYDELTGLPNRKLFHDECEQVLLTARATGEQPTMILLGLDGFRDVNDALGHDHGDLLLMEVARRLRAGMRAGDTICRLGGDEFTVLFANSGPAIGEQAAQRMIAAFDIPFLIEDVAVDLEVSIGVATAQPGDDALTFLRHADTAMYAAKENKLGYTCYVSGPESDTTARFRLLGELRRALDQQEIVLHYQPTIAIDTGEALGVEALARWHHPSRGLLAPAEFIPVVEDTALSHRFTSYVLANALAQARRWMDQGIRLPVSVNVSTRCLLDPQFPDTVAQRLLAADVPGELLCIEITESTVMADPTRAIDALRRIRAMGARTALDDFGTGYSSMAYLRVLPLDELKIDKSFVADIAGDGSNTALVQSAIDLGHNLGLVVVAEGVETAEVLATLRTLGCDVAQGYHFARPMPAEAFSTWQRATSGRDSRELPTAL